MLEALREGGPRKREGGGARWGCGGDVLLDAELGDIGAGCGIGGRRVLVGDQDMVTG